jgi:hypothetical protein
MSAIDGATAVDHCRNGQGAVVACDPLRTLSLRCLPMAVGSAYDDRVREWHGDKGPITDVLHAKTAGRSITLTELQPEHGTPHHRTLHVPQANDIKPHANDLDRVFP